MKTVILQGSARSEGNTNKVVLTLKNKIKCDVLDLNTYQISPYDYGHQNKDDDFLPLMNSLLEYDLIIFATPVYWYTMSGTMKIFFDRITDCLTIEKELGRKLRGKSMAAISCSQDNKGTEAFFIPFKNTAEYLGMNYLGDFHAWTVNDEVAKQAKSAISKFAAKLKTKRK